MVWDWNPARYLNLRSVPHKPGQTHVGLVDELAESNWLDRSRREAFERPAMEKRMNRASLDQDRTRFTDTSGHLDLRCCPLCTRRQTPQRRTSTDRLTPFTLGPTHQVTPSASTVLVNFPLGKVPRVPAG